MWIGGASLGPHSAKFVPPHYRHVGNAITDLVAFMARDDIPVLVQAALTHAQFETIHPFTDGNGRTGRALLHAMLANKGLTRNVTVPVSAGLLVDIDAYFAALTTYRQGQPRGHRGTAGRRNVRQRSPTVANSCADCATFAPAGRTGSAPVATQASGGSSTW